MKPHIRLHCALNPHGILYWWASRGEHRTLAYVDSAEAIAVARLVLNAPPRLVL